MDPNFFFILINLYVAFAKQSLSEPEFPEDQNGKGSTEKGNQDLLGLLKRTALSEKRNVEVFSHDQKGVLVMFFLYNFLICE